MDNFEYKFNDFHNKIIQSFNVSSGSDMDNRINAWKKDILEMIKTGFNNNDSFAYISEDITKQLEQVDTTLADELNNLKKNDQLNDETKETIDGLKESLIELQLISFFDICKGSIEKAREDTTVPPSAKIDLSKFFKALTNKQKLLIDSKTSLLNSYDKIQKLGTNLERHLKTFDFESIARECEEYFELPPTGTTELTEATGREEDAAGKEDTEDTEDIYEDTKEDEEKDGKRDIGATTGGGLTSLKTSAKKLVLASSLMKKDKKLEISFSVKHELPQNIVNKIKYYSDLEKILFFLYNTIVQQFNNYSNIDKYLATIINNTNVSLNTIINCIWLLFCNLYIDKYKTQINTKYSDQCSGDNLQNHRIFVETYLKYRNMLKASIAMKRNRSKINDARQKGYISYEDSGLSKLEKQETMRCRILNFTTGEVPISKLVDVCNNNVTTRADYNAQLKLNEEKIKQNELTLIDSKKLEKSKDPKEPEESDKSDELGEPKETEETEETEKTDEPEEPEEPEEPPSSEYIPLSKLLEISINTFNLSDDDNYNQFDKHVTAILTSYNSSPADKKTEFRNNNHKSFLKVKFELLGDMMNNIHEEYISYYKHLDVKNNLEICKNIQKNEVNFTTKYKLHNKLYKLLLFLIDSSIFHHLLSLFFGYIIEPSVKESIDVNICILTSP
jgi:hypothetical protein